MKRVPSLVAVGVALFAASAFAEMSPPVQSAVERLLPPGSVADVAFRDDSGIARIAVTIPAESSFGPISEVEARLIDEGLTGALSEAQAAVGSEIQVRIGAGPYLLLGAYVDQPQPPAPAQPEQPDVAKPAPPGPPAVDLAAAPGHADGQPVGALSGVVVYVSAGHGWTAGSSDWYLQRGLVLNMIEDYGNLEQLNAFVNYLYNAGATVVPFRPVGYQGREVVLDNDDPGVTYTGSWTDSTTAAAYYENGATTSGVGYRYCTSTVAETARARYTPTIPVSDFYPVYCWTRDNTDRVVQTYRIRHSGGTATVKIDHQRVGKGWIWLGNYYFEAGTAGWVEISNQATSVSTVVADAIRFGNGMGDVVGSGPGTVSGFLREEECSRYWAQSEAGLNAVGLPAVWDCCSDDGSDNVGTAARWAREMNRTDVNNDRWRRIYMEFHSNAAGCGSSTCGAKGTVALYNLGADGTTNQLLYAQTIGQKIETDMKALQSGFEYTWGSRYPNTYHASFAYGAIGTAANDNEFDATILEVAFHDNTEDAANLRSAKVRDAVARSTLQGIVSFLSNAGTFPGTQVPAVYLPEPPERVRAAHDGAGRIVVSWMPPPTGGALGHPATGYRIYRSTNGYGFGNVVDVGNASSAVLEDVPAGATTYLRVAAYNAGGESLPSRTMAVRHDGSSPSKALIVDGYNRVGRQQNVVESTPYGAMERPIARKVNSFDYAVQHASALAASGATFDYAENTAVMAGDTTLGGYRAAIWILGQESSQDKTFSSGEQVLVSSYLGAGGNLFVSGSEIAYELDSLNAGRTFYEGTLKGNYVADSAGTFNVSPAPIGIFAGLDAFDFDPANGAAYKVNSADVIAAQSGALANLAYVGGTGGTAGIQYDSGFARVVMLAFPFEAISSATARQAVMSRVAEYLLPAPGCPFEPDPLARFEGYAEGAQVAFQQPRYSGSTLAHLAASPDVSAVTTAVPAADGNGSCKVEWAWLDASPTRWLRLTTNQAANLPNPTIDLRRPVRLRLRLDSGSLRVCMGVRETGVDVSVGENGGTAGTIEWVGAGGVTPGGGPLGTLVTGQPGVWQTLTFRPQPGLVQAMTGDGFLDAANDKGVLEHLAFSVVDGPGPFTVYIDGLEQPCPPRADIDGDADVDQDDFAVLQRCLTGMAMPQTDPACQGAKLDNDTDVDGADYALFENCLSGSGIPADPECE